MANKNFQKKKIEETSGSGFGQYMEGVGGGGSPHPKDPNQRAPGVNSEYRKENNKTDQPRTKSGEFTYKSVNGQSIDPKYGPSRCKTVNPLLTGGVNGIKIEDVEQDFYSQSGTYWNKYKDKWYQKGGEIVTTDLKTRVAGDAIWNVAKRKYDSVKGEFESESSVFEETKKGRAGKEEQAAKQKAYVTGEEQAVINPSTGGIKLKPGTVVPKPTPVAPTAGSSVGATPVIPAGGVGSGVSKQPVNVSTQSVGDIANADYTPKYSDDQIGQVKSILKQSGFDDNDLASFDALSPKEKDEYIDKYFGEEEESEVEETKTEAEAEDSEATKKIKGMGFSE